ncbi:putative Ig domain-containing protein, partial [Corynebacterium sp. MSK195]|uniref:putative Ig domain-containing protein n=1 Tax=Corynebacterium sp. MSK195 TaxID=3050216 RepID=UPI00254C3C7E
AKVVVKDRDGNKVGDPIDVKITAPKTDAPDTSNASVVPDTVTVVEGQEAKPFEVAKNIPEGGKVVVDGLPDGLSVDESTGEVTGTPSVSDWGKDEEERDVEVAVSVTDKDGKEVAQGTKIVTVQRDTDGDGQPDVTDTDDDNDGATDAEEAAAGTDPKDASSKPAQTDEPSVVTDKVTVVDGQEADPFEVAKNIPEGGKVAAEGLPDGLSIDESTGEVTGTPSVSDWGKDEEERDVEVAVSVTDKDGKEVAQGTKIVTVQRDTDGDGQPDVTDTDDDNDGATDAEEAAAGTDPKDASSKPEAKPGDDQGATSVDKSDVKDVKPSGEEQNTGIKVTNPDEGTKVSATDKNGKDVPAKIDDNGNVVVTPGKDVEGPITVVVEDEDLDGGKAEVEVGVKDEEPDNQGGSSDLPDGSSLPGQSSGSSNVDWKRCAPAAAGVGIPLLFLIPVGLASQMNIPGFSPLMKQISAQIDGINRQLGAQTVQFQKQLGIYNGPLARQANQINVMLKKSGVDRVAGGVALAAAGALALGLVASACSPNGGSSSSSSSSK